MKNLVLSLGALALLSLPAFAESAAPSKADTIWPKEAIKWEPGPVPGTQVAKLWGDWMKEGSGPYGVLVKFDAGVIHGSHKHSHDLKIVVLSGTFVHIPDGGKESKLGPGSYLLQAGGTNHTSGCAAGAPCEFFMASDGTFNMTMKDAPAEPAKK